jgi:hypothetical protein
MTHIIIIMDCTQKRKTMEYNISQLDYLSTQSGQSPTSLTDYAIRNVCPAMTDVLNSCTNPDVVAAVKNHPYYTQYCQYLQCTQAQQTLNKVEGDFNSGVTDGTINEPQNYLGLLQNVCPAFQNVLNNTCPSGTSAKILQDSLWTNYCNNNVCLNKRYTVSKTIDDMRAQTNGLTGTYLANAQNDNLTKSICPAYNDLIKNGTCSSDLINKYKQDYWYVNGCMPLACNSNKLNLNKQINAYNDSLPYSNDYGNAATLTNRVCPMYPAISQSCDAASIAQIQSGSFWDQCKNGANCPLLSYYYGDVKSKGRGSLWRNQFCTLMRDPNSTNCGYSLTDTVFTANC